MGEIMDVTENVLRKADVQRLSEHQLRVQRSLQNLEVPNWYNRSSVPSEGFILLRSNFKNQQKNRNSWQETSQLASKKTMTNSASSMRSSNSSLTYQQLRCFRWSTSNLNSLSGTSTPSSRTSCDSFHHNDEGLNVFRNSLAYKKPYLGWRCQERVSQPRTPAERLANSLLPSMAEEAEDTSVELHPTSIISVNSSNLRSSASQSLQSQELSDTTNQNIEEVNDGSTNTLLRLASLENLMNSLLGLPGS